MKPAEPASKSTQSFNQVSSGRKKSRKLWPEDDDSWIKNKTAKKSVKKTVKTLAKKSGENTNSENTNVPSKVEKLNLRYTNSNFIYMPDFRKYQLKSPKTSLPEKLALKKSKWRVATLMSF